MKVIQQSDCDIADISSALLEGQTLIYPTETCYGLGCDATNQAAVDRMYTIKGREAGKPLIMLVPSVEMVKEYIVWNTTLETLAQKYWPGPLTIVAEAKAECGLAAGVISPEGTIAVRVTAYHFAWELADALDRPLVSTSANLAGGTSPYSIEEVQTTFAHASSQPDIIIDAGALPKNAPSTIIRVLPDGGVRVLRQGELRVTL